MKILAFHSLNGKDQPAQHQWAQHRLVLRMDLQMDHQVMGQLNQHQHLLLLIVHQELIIYLMKIAIR